MSIAPDTSTHHPDPDPRRLQVHRAPPARDVPYVPSDEPVVAAMLRFGNVTSSDVVYDLGCGDGRIVIAAARHHGARGVGVDIDPRRIGESRENGHKAGVSQRVRFLCQSFFDTDIRDATVVFLYLLPSINVKLRPKLLLELKPGTRIIANYFSMGDWPADMRADVHHRTLWQWIVPANPWGTWRCVVNRPQRRQRMVLRMERKYQTVLGTARLDGQQIPLSNGRLFGDQITFKLYDPKYRRPVLRFSGRVDGGCLRDGVCHEGLEGPPMAWGGVREQVVQRHTALL